MNQLSERAARKTSSARRQRNEEREQKRTSRLAEMGGVVYSDDKVFISHRGVTEDADEVVVAFTARSFRLGVEDGEEVLGIERAGRNRAALVVADPTMSSYSQPGQAATIERVLREQIARLGNPEVTTYGSSIGGTMAFRFARALGAQAALCIAPLCSTDAQRYEEPRWENLKKRIRAGGAVTLGTDMSPDCRYVTFHAAEETEEWRHFSFVSRLPGVEAYLLARGGHGMSKQLGKNGVLSPLIDAIMAGEPVPEEVLALCADAETTREALNAMVGVRDGNGKLIEPMRLEDSAMAKVASPDKSSPQRAA